jgi:hypothetical protein
MIGDQEFNKINIQSYPRTRVEIGMNVTKSLLFFPIEFSDLVDRELEPAPADREVYAHSITKSELTREYLKNNIVTDFRFDFIQRTIFINYYGYLDILQELGGLNNMAKLGLSFFAAFFLVKFMMDVVYYI